MGVDEFITKLNKSSAEYFWNYFLKKKKGNLLLLSLKGYQNKFNQPSSESL